MKLAKGATAAMKLLPWSRRITGMKGSVFGNGKDYYKELFLPLMPGFKLAPFNDLEAVKALASKRTAAIVLEPVQGEGGIHVAKKEYMLGLRKLCDELGIMLVFDEVQTGIGRTGKLWCSEHYGVVPDIMFLAKSISGGLYPNGAVVYRDIKLLSDYVDKNPTFHAALSGGTDLACIVSSRVLDFIIDNKISDNAAVAGKRFKEGLEAFMA
jgi:acetylornithine/succinyldiaminopimelate/putrescine aminotransferase